MYQIIYIDIDEEITSVIDKLRKVKTTEVFLTIPKRALILQSIISLKLLFREAERSKKHMIVVTQDPQEQKTVEKAGIETRSSLEGLDTEGEMRESVAPKIQDDDYSIKKAVAQKKFQRKSMEEIGSNDFYDVLTGNKVREKRDLIREETSSNESPKRMMSEISRGKKIERELEIEKKYVPTWQASLSAEKQELPKLSSFSEANKKGDMLGSFFEPKISDAEKTAKFKETPKKQISVSGKLKKALFVLFFSGLLIAVGALAYLFLPQAQIRVSVKSQAMEKDLNLSGDIKLVEVDVQELAIPVRMAEKEDVYTFSYPVTGKGVSTGKKAKGTVVIYNEFSSASQSLVATTRLESPDKKIFRLTKGVTVPGSSEVDGKVVPGAIEAEVIADGSGEEYNIDPATFSIPGFAGSAKFAKFSAKSSAKMMGGSAQGQESGGATSLTQTDITMAKAKAEEAAKAKIKEALKGGMEEGEFFPESVTEETILESSSLSKTGDVVAEFQYQVRVKSQGLVFAEKDIKRILANAFKIDDSAENQSNISLDYGAMSGDLSVGTMNIKVHGKLSSNSQLDTEKLKKDLAGKSASEIEEVLKDYPQISEIEINIKPAFLFERVPQIASRIEIVIN